LTVDNNPYRALPSGPFTRAQALAAGFTPRMLQGEGFVRLFPRVWRRSSHEMSDADRVRAARLALPEQAHLTGISLIQELGLDYGPRKPIHFVVAGDLHLTFEGVFLHRTKALAPLQESDVCVEAAFMAYCVQCRVIDAIKVGDWLLHNGHMDLNKLEALATAHPWRDGAYEALWVLEYLDPDSWSLKESETRGILEFAGLPRPECNKHLLEITARIVITDLLYRAYGLAVEFEGVQHQQDRHQYTKDLDRYALMRIAGVGYVQVTNEKLQRPRRLVLDVHRALVARGYDGPPPCGSRLPTHRPPVDHGCLPTAPRVARESSGPVRRVNRTGPLVISSCQSSARSFSPSTRWWPSNWWPSAA
jgi:hypothetical protein